MPCYNPRAAWRDKDVNSNGKRELIFNRRASYLESDYQIGCGKCTGCIADKARDWSIRLAHEAQYHDQSAFLTLTYDQENVPTTINVRDTQLFWKKLRKELDQQVQYFITGEYGETTRRPHYHALVFGTDFLGGALNLNDRLFTNPHLDKIWGNGFVSIGPVTTASCMYVAGYVQKKANDPDTFSRMSKGSIRQHQLNHPPNPFRTPLPPIGYRWAEDNVDQMARDGFIVLQGEKFPIPRSYLDWFPVELDPRPRQLEDAYVDPLANASRELNQKARRALNKETL